MKSEIEMKVNIKGVANHIKQLEEQCEDLKSDHKHNLKLMKGLNDKIAELEQQIEKMKCCQNCDNWNWKHKRCEKKLKGDCFKASKWILRR